jgi:hypothetical protein
MKDKVQLEACSQPVLVHTVKAVDKLGLKCTQGSWKEYVKVSMAPSRQAILFISSMIDMPPVPFPHTHAGDGSMG